MRSFHSLHCAALRHGQPGLGCCIPAIQPLQHSSARRGRPGHTTQTFSTAIGTDSPNHVFSTATEPEHLFSFVPMHSTSVARLSRSLFPFTLHGCPRSVFLHHSHL